MKIKIEIRADNAAFMDGAVAGENFGLETARLLRELANRVEGESLRSLMLTGKLNQMDSNGNKVGFFKVYKERRTHEKR